jgi:hypothetical protein
MIKLFLLLSVGLSIALKAQDQGLVLSLEQAERLMQSNHKLLHNAYLETETARKKRFGWLPADPVSLHLFYGKTPLTEKDYVFESQVPIGSVPAWFRYREFRQQQISMKESEFQGLKRELGLELKQDYYRWLFSDKKRMVYGHFLELLRQNPGRNDSLAGEELTMLQVMALNNRVFGIETKHKKQETETAQMALKVRELTLAEGDWQPDHRTTEIYIIEFPGPKEEEYPGPGQVLEYYHRVLNTERKRAWFENSSLYPGLVLGAFAHRSGGYKGFQGIYAGMTLPLSEWISSSAKTERELKVKQAENILEQQEYVFNRQIEYLIYELDKQHLTLQHHYEHVLPYANVLREESLAQFKEGKMKHEDFLNNLVLVMEMELLYLEVLEAYNLSAIELEYLIQ